jgi:predicted aspartyl protease
MKEKGVVIMGRIVASMRVDNLVDPTKTLRFDALVDTGAALLVLPQAWRNRLGDLDVIREVELETATQTLVKGEVCGPVKIQIEGFRPVYGEILFVEMTPQDGVYEPLLGYIVLESSQAGVDMLGHRLVPIKHMDLK